MKKLIGTVIPLLLCLVAVLVIAGTRMHQITCNSNLTECEAFMFYGWWWAAAIASIQVSIIFQLLSAWWFTRRPRLAATTKAVFTMDQIESILDVATVVTIQHPVTADHLVDAMKREGTLADRGLSTEILVSLVEPNSCGVTVEEAIHLLWTIGNMGRKGIMAAEAGKSLRNVMSRLRDGESFTGSDGPIDPASVQAGDES